MRVYPSEAAQATVIAVGDEEFDGGLTAAGTFLTRDGDRWRCTITMEPYDGSEEEAPVPQLPDTDLITYTQEAERGITLLAETRTTAEYDLVTRGLLAETSSTGALATTDDEAISQAVDGILAELTTARRA